MKKPILFVFSLFSIMLVQGQTSHKSFVQNIPHTSLSFSMEAIPGGTFRMGSQSAGHTNEKPQHKVKVSPFWMSTYEITWDLFEAFLYPDYEASKRTDGETREKADAVTQPTGIDAITRPTKPYLDMTFGMGKEGQPAVGMTHFNAVQFCKWLFLRTGVFYRLPTEAEWEYACRAGSTTEYYYGDNAALLDEYAWYEDNSDNKTHKVGQKKPNAFGLYDMIGNASEWTYDQYVPDYGKRTGEVIEDPVSVPTELYPHVVRGGSFMSVADELRSAARGFSDPSWKQLDPQVPKSNWWFPEAPFIGFRIVRPLNPPPIEEIIKYYNQKPIEDY